MMRFPKTFPVDRVKADINIKNLDDVIRRKLGEYGQELLELTVESVNLSKPYQTESSDKLVADFRNECFHLWTIKNNGEPKREAKNLRYGSVPARVCVGINYLAALDGLFGEPVKIWMFSHGVPEIKHNNQIIFNSLNSGDVTRYLKGKVGRDVFGYKRETDTLTLEYIPTGIIL